MRHTMLYPVFALLLVVFPARPAATGEIELRDGSVIIGEIVSLNGGVYTITTESLGLQKVDASQVRAIRLQEAENPLVGPALGRQSESGADIAGQAKTFQDKMMSDTEIMEMVRSLEHDPDFKRILEDPQVVNAVNSGDIAALIANPQFMKLLNNRTVKEITEKTIQK